MQKRSWKLPIKLISEANTHEHWRKSHKRHKEQKAIVRLFVKDLSFLRDKPIEIKMTRIAPRSLDSHDNLRMAFKWVCDALAGLIYDGLCDGRADDKNSLKWTYAQEKGKVREYAIKIEIFDNMQENGE